MTWNVAFFSQLQLTEGDKEVAMGTMGMGKADPIHTEQETLALVECIGYEAPGSRIPEF